MFHLISTLAAKIHRYTKQIKIERNSMHKFNKWCLLVPFHFADIVYAEFYEY